MGRKIDDFDPISAFPNDRFQGLPFNFNAQGHTDPVETPSDCVPCILYPIISPYFLFGRFVIEI